MDDDACNVFEAYGLSNEVADNTGDQNQNAVWAQALVDRIFDDPDCERLQVASIISAIKELGFPFANKIVKLEKQLDPNNVGLSVDKLTLNREVEKLLSSCDEEKYDEVSYEINDKSTEFVFATAQASSIVESLLRKEEMFKNEISSLSVAINASEDKIKMLQLENGAMKKSQKYLQVTLQKAVLDKVTAEECKLTAEEVHHLEMSERNMEISGLEKQLKFLKEQLMITSKENEALSAKVEDYNCQISDLHDAFVAKCDQLNELELEHGNLIISLEANIEKQHQIDKINNRLVNSNLELIDQRNELKNKIKELGEERDLLSKRLLVTLSQIEKGEIITNNSSDIESVSSNSGEVSKFSPKFFSSPMANANLSVEIAATVVQQTTMESTPKIACLTDDESRPASHLAEWTASLIQAQKPARKRKLFCAPSLEPLKVTKRHRSLNQAPTSTLALHRTAALPFELPTSFAINLPTRQTLLRDLRQTLRIHPHLCGPFREFISAFASDGFTGTELLPADLSSRFYEYCTTNLSVPFRGRQFLRAVCEERPVQFDAADTCRAEDLNEFGCDFLENGIAITFSEFTLEMSHQSTRVFELENNNETEAEHVLEEPNVTDDNYTRVEISSEANDEVPQNKDFLISEVLLPDIQDPQCCTPTPVISTSVQSGTLINVITVRSDHPKDALFSSLNKNGAMDSEIFPSEALECNHNVSELGHSASSLDYPRVHISCTTLNESDCGYSDVLRCEDADFSDVLLENTPNCDNCLSDLGPLSSSPTNIVTTLLTSADNNVSTRSNHQEGVSYIFDHEDVFSMDTIPQNSYNNGIEVFEKGNRGNSTNSTPITTSICSEILMPNQNINSNGTPGSVDDLDTDSNSSACISIELSFELYSDSELDSKSSTKLETLPSPSVAIAAIESDTDFLKAGVRSVYDYHSEGDGRQTDEDTMTSTEQAASFDEALVVSSVLSVIEEDSEEDVSISDEDIPNGADKADDVALVDSYVLSINYVDSEDDVTVDSNDKRDNVAQMDPSVLPTNDVDSEEDFTESDIGVPNGADEADVDVALVDSPILSVHDEDSEEDFTAYGADEADVVALVDSPVLSVHDEDSEEDFTANGADEADVDVALVDSPVLSVHDEDSEEDFTENGADEADVVALVDSPVLSVHDEDSEEDFTENGADEADVVALVDSPVLSVHDEDSEEDFTENGADEADVDVALVDSPVLSVHDEDSEEDFTENGADEADDVGLVGSPVLSVHDEDSEEDFTANGADEADIDVALVDSPVLSVHDEDSEEDFTANGADEADIDVALVDSPVLSVHDEDSEEDVTEPDAEIPNGIDKSDVNVSQEKSYFFIPLPSQRVERRRLQCFMFTVLTVLLFFFVFCFYIFLGKILLTDVDYQNFLMSIGGKFQHHGKPPY